MYDWSSGSCINDQNWVAGWILPSAMEIKRAFLYKGSEMLAIGKKWGGAIQKWILNEVFLINRPGLEQPPVISIQPAGGTVGSGDPLHLVVSAIGGLPLEYQWLKDEQPIPGANQREYSVAHVDGTHAGSATRCG